MKNQQVIRIVAHYTDSLQGGLDIVYHIEIDRPSVSRVELRHSDMVELIEKSIDIVDRATKLSEYNRELANISEVVEEYTNEEEENLDPKSVLTNQEVRDIRERYRDRNVTERQLCREYGVSYKTINRALRGETYRNAGGKLWLRTGKDRF